MSVLNSLLNTDFKSNELNEIKSEESPKPTTAEFVVIEWFTNKVYTIIQNYKNVKINDLVTCNVNNIKDTGTVIFIGK